MGHFQHAEKVRRQTEHKILSAMYCKLDDLDTHYLYNYYDGHMSMLNTGGMTLVSGQFFDWSRNVMDATRERISVSLLKRDPKRDLAAAKAAILKDTSLRDVFHKTCRQNFASQSAIDIVCNQILRKIVHVKYANHFGRFKEKEVRMKDKIAQRNHLKVAEAHKTGPPKKKSCKSRGAQ